MQLRDSRDARQHGLVLGGASERVADTRPGERHQLLLGCHTTSAPGDDSATLDQTHQLATSVRSVTARDWFAVLSEVSCRARWQVAGVVAAAVGIRVPNAWMPARRRVPICGCPQRTAPPRFDEVPKLGLCTRGVTRSGEKLRCHEPLSSAPAIRLAVDPAVVIQRKLLCVLRAGYASGGIYGSAPVPSTVFMRDLHTLGTWMLRYAQPCDVTARISDLLWEQFVCAAKKRFARPLVAGAGARVTFSSAAASAATACMAMPILQADNTEIAAQGLQWLTTSMRRRGLAPTDYRNAWSTGHSRSLNALRRTVLSSGNANQQVTTRPLSRTEPQRSAVLFAGSQPPLAGFRRGGGQEAGRVERKQL